MISATDEAKISVRKKTDSLDAWPKKQLYMVGGTQNKVQLTYK